MSACSVCDTARHDGHWTAVLAANETHCRDCHETFRRHEHHCVRCHATFGGARGASDHDPGGLGRQCREPASYGLAPNERGVWGRRPVFPDRPHMEANQAQREDAA
jgi:hypothetical protein